MFKKMLLSLASGLFGMVFFVSAASAATVGIVQVQVVDQNGDPLEGLAVNLEQGGFPVNFGTTNASGYANFTFVEEGDYTAVLSPSMSWGCSACALLEEQENTFTVSSSLATFDEALFTDVQVVGPYQMEAASRFMTVHLVDNNGADVVDVNVNAYEMFAGEWDENNPPGYANGVSDSNGEFSFAVSEASTGLWSISVDPSFSQEESAKQYTSAWRSEIEVAADGETTVEIELQKTDATIVASLVDGDGATVTLDLMEFANVNCFEPWNETAGMNFQPMFFFTNINGGESGATLNVVGGKDYECSGWMQGGALVGGTVSVPANGSVALTLTQLSYDAEIIVRAVDSDGNVITQASGSGDSSSMKDPDGNDYWSDWHWGQLTEGTATLEALDGYTYMVGLYVMDDNQQKMMQLGAQSVDRDIEGFIVAADGTRYTQNFERKEVVAVAGTPQVVDIELKEADATVEATLLDKDGQPIPFGWVDGFEVKEQQSQDKGKDKGEEGGDMMPGWGNFVGSMTDENGVATLYIASGTYNFGAYTPNSFGGNTLPPARQTLTVKKDATVTLTLQEVEADWTVNLTLSTDDGATLDYAYCFMFDDKNGYNNFADVQDGVGSIAFARNASGHLGCFGYAEGTSYFSSEQTVNTGSKKNGSSSVAVVMQEGSPFYEQQTTVVSATSTTTVTLPDGESTLTIPADCLAESGNITVQIESATGFKVDETAFPVESFDYSFLDSSNTEITGVQEGCAGLTLTQHYDEEQLEKYDLTESQLNGLGHYDEDNKSWEAASTTIDTDADTLTSSLTEFSPYGILGSKQSISKPKKPKKAKLKAKKMTDSSATAKWGSVSGATYYKVYVAKQTAKWKKVKLYKNVSKTSLKLKKLGAGTMHRFKVRACNSAGCSAWSVWKKFSTMPE